MKKSPTRQARDDIVRRALGEGMKQACDEAVKIAGGASTLGPALGITRSAVSMWKNVPYDKVLDVERLTGVSRHRLRPDLYGPPPAAPATQDAAAVD
jgi:DNA-binding transcriptional regulator YdaS (Cro superfamily)